MRRSLLGPLCAVILSVTASALGADVKISYLSGPVMAYRNGTWGEASRGMVLSSNDKIKTVSNSRATLTVNGNSRIWVTPDTELAIGEVDRGNTFRLLIGKIRAKAKQLAGRKFQVQTPVSVCSVRGTFWLNGVTGSGQSSTAVIEGQVAVAFGGAAAPPGAALAGPALQEIVLGPGQMLDSGVEGVQAMTPDMIAAIEQEQQQDEEQETGGDQQQQQEQGGQEEDKKEQTLDLRNELRTVVNDVRNGIAEQRELTNEIKDSDFSAGRTLRDVHGNVVRVEQHLLRPDDQTLQLLNLTKRSEYVYSDRQGWGFTVPNSSRLDVMDVKIRMNMALPDDITAWPSYISSKGDDLHPQSVDVLMTNQEDTLLSRGDWRLKGQLDEKGRTLSEDQLVFDAYINGWKVDPGYESPDHGENYPEDGREPADLYMWGVSPTMRLTRDGSEKFVKLFTEAYALNNSGGILKLNDFTSTRDDPFTVLKQVAGEQIIFCRDASDPSQSFFTRGNLDLVYTPDLAIVVGEKLATQVGDLTRSSSKD